MSARPRPRTRPPAREATAIWTVTHAPCRRKGSVRYWKKSRIGGARRGGPRPSVPRGSGGRRTRLLAEDLGRGHEGRVHAVLLEERLLRPVGLEGVDRL